MRKKPKSKSIIEETIVVKMESMLKIEVKGGDSFELSSGRRN